MSLFIPMAKKKTPGKEDPSYYAIIPAPIRYDKELSEFQKLLYGEISCLTDKHGYCRASNAYFARLYGKSSTRVSKAIKGLETQGHITSSISKDEGNVRKIYMGGIKKIKEAIEQKDNTPSGIKVQEGLEENSNPPIAQNSNHNNTSSIETSIAVPQTTPTDRNIEFQHGMRDAEKRGSGYLKSRNEIMGKDEILNSSVQRELYNLCKAIDYEVFKLRVAKFKEVLDRVMENKAEKYLYYPVRDYDFQQFAIKINKFYEKDDVPMIIKRLAKKESMKELNAFLSKKSQVSGGQTSEEIKPLTDEERKKASEKAHAVYSDFRSKFANKTA